MESSFFARGLLIGLSLAATVGPICILCIQRTLYKGYPHGLVSGLGAATADATYSCVAAFGLTFIAHFLVSQQIWIRGIGGLFLLYLGVKTIFSKPAQRAASATANNLAGAYTSTLLLTLTNPLTILSFAAIFAGFGLGNIASRSYLSALLTVLGVFTGSATGISLITGAVGLLRGKFTPRWLLWLNRISGVALTLFGIIALAGLL